MVIYGTMTETSIGQLFIAGIVPGLLGVLFYMAAVTFVVWRDPDAGPAADPMSWAERIAAIRKVATILGLFLLVMGGIYLGIFTATEAAGIGAAGALVISLARGTLTVSSLLAILASTARTTAMLMAVLVGALIFGNFITVAGIPSTVVGAINALGLSPLGVIFSLIVFYIVLGSVFDELAMILLTIPVFFPLVMDLGFDPIWFGIVIVMVVEIGLICPPIGMNLFVIKTAARTVPMTTIFRGITPFVVADFLRLALIVVLPWLVLFLPHQMAN
jgi:tripartite ATP-independent transporter DctM subunit